ncbi:MAG: 2-C-methyl-D-erythritol 2,4-cyclodiphosphate synthase, partial [Endomicrobiia bacterium]
MNKKQITSELRVGIGYDLHRLTKNKKLFLAGVEVEVPFGLKSHSDGDVILHSVCDAILGACALPDIGQLFPDTDPNIKGIDSKLIAKKVLDLVNKKKFSLVNLDIV